MPNSYVDKDRHTYKPFVIWSEQMLKLFGELRGNQYEINNLLSRFFIEMEQAKEESDRKISSLEDRIAELERTQ